MKKLLLLLSMVLLLTACGNSNPKDAAELIDNWNNKDKPNINFTIKASIDANCKIFGEELKVKGDISSKTNYKKLVDTIKLNNDIEGSLLVNEETENIKGNIIVNIIKNTEQVEIFGKTSDDENYDKRVLDAKGIVELLTNNLKLNSEGFILEKRIIPVNDIKCYEVKGNLTTANINSIFKSVEAINLKEEINIPITLYFRQDTRDLFVVTIDLKDTIKDLITKSINMDEEFKFSTLTSSLPLEQLFEINAEKLTIEIFDINLDDKGIIFIPTNVNKE